MIPWTTLYRGQTFLGVRNAKKLAMFSTPQHLLEESVFSCESKSRTYRPLTVRHINKYNDNWVKHDQINAYQTRYIVILWLWLNCIMLLNCIACHRGLRHSLPTPTYTVAGWSDRLWILQLRSGQHPGGECEQRIPGDQLQPLRHSRALDGCDGGGLLTVTTPSYQHTGREDVMTQTVSLPPPVQIVSSCRVEPLQCFL